MWFTDQQITALPAFTGLSTEQIAQAAVDAGQLYQQITADPGISDQDLRTWAQGAGITPDRYNTAVQALAQAGKAVDLSAGPLAPVTQPTAAPVTAGGLGAIAANAGLISYQHFQAGELREVARRLKLDVPKSATKAQLAELLAAAPT